MKTSLSRQKFFREICGYDAQQVLTLSNYDGYGNLFFEIPDSHLCAVIKLHDWKHPAKSERENLVMLVNQAGKTRFLKWNGVDPWEKRQKRIELNLASKLALKKEDCKQGTLDLFGEPAKVEESPP